MRINVYSQELTDEVQLQEKVSNTGLTYSAVQFVLHSSPLLHHPPADDDRSAVTFWLPKSPERRESLAVAFEKAAAYDEYLQSDLWAGIKAAVLASANGKCRACGKPAYTVHHVSYAVEVMRGTARGQLVAICRGCHRAIEFDRNGKKRTYAADIAEALTRRAQKRKHKIGKKSRPICRCCRKPRKTLGRENICLGCYKSYGPAVHARAVQRDRENAD